jgi:6-pyruvoyltetrahydropterin/6-carboxytetrahydropterin synthase
LIEKGCFWQLLITGKMIYVSRKEHFNAAHKLYNPNWTKEKNEEIFGACANEYFHGHNFELIVTVKGNPDPDTGFVIDLKKLGDIVKELVINKVDHKNLNIDVDFMQGKMASCEIFIIEIWNILAPAIKQTAPQSSLYRLQLYETNKNFVEYFGE